VSCVYIYIIFFFFFFNFTRFDPLYFGLFFECFMCLLLFLCVMYTNNHEKINIYQSLYAYIMHVYILLKY